jgi:glutamyl endopeptidase
MYAENMVATAGHCVFDHGQWAKSVIVSPGRSDEICPYGQCHGSKLFATPDWITNRDDEFDYGAIKLDCPIGRSTGWFGLDWQGLTDSTVLTLAGYRQFGFGDRPRSQKTQPSRPAAIEERLVFYAHDTYKGDSGAPLFTTDGIARSIHGTSCHPIAGIDPPVQGDKRVCATNGSIHARFNHGVRVTPAVVANLAAWRDAN